MGIGTMTREEKAVIYVTSQYLTPSTLMPVVEGYEEVHFEVELVHLIQVFKLLPSNTYLFVSILPNITMQRPFGWQAVSI